MHWMDTDGSDSEAAKQDNDLALLLREVTIIGTIVFIHYQVYLQRYQMRSLIEQAK